MDLYHKILTGVVLVLIFGGVVGAIEYVNVREEKARLDERQKADAAVMAAKDAQLAASKSALDKASADFEVYKRDQDAKMNAMELRFANTKTPDQSATLTAALLGLQAGSVKVGGTKEAPTLEIPVAQQQAYEKTCEECKLNLTSATKQIELASQREAFLQSQSDDLKEKLGLITKERDDLKKFNAGGSTWTQVKHDAKAGFFGAAIEAVLLALTGHLK
jgi:hypothetical protein